MYIKPINPVAFRGYPPMHSYRGIPTETKEKRVLLPFPEEMYEGMMYYPTATSSILKSLTKLV